MWSIPFGNTQSAPKGVRLLPGTQMSDAEVNAARERVRVKRALRVAGQSAQADILTQAYESASRKVSTIEPEYREMMAAAGLLPELGTLESLQHAYEQLGGPAQYIYVEYPGWQAKGRQVRKGEHALGLYMPVTGKKRVTRVDDDGKESESEVSYTHFVLRSNWFVLSQTEGQEYQSPDLPAWDQHQALATLNISQVPFEITEGNVQGYAQPGRKLALNPLGDHLPQTLFHEVAHIVLGHCDEAMQSDSERTPKSLREVEAESVALLCSEALGIPGAEYSRGYIQSWAPGLKQIPEKSCQRIFKAANVILEAGRRKQDQPLAAAA